VLGEARAAFGGTDREPVTHRQFYYLDLISRGEGALTAGELAARLGVTRPTVSAVLAGLEAAGYVRKKRSAVDRRSFGLVLTAKGEAAVREHDETYAVLLGFFESHLTPAERATMLRLFDKIERALEAATAAAGDPRRSAPPRALRRRSGKDGRS